MTENESGRLLELLSSNSNGLVDAKELFRISKLLEYSFSVGFMLGGFTSGRSAMLQFMAEHQHLLPLKKRSDYVMYVRNRNYRVMAGFGMGGIVRGVQMAGVAAVYSAVRIGSARQRQSIGLQQQQSQWADDLVGGMVAGALFAYAGRGHRLYYLRKGIVFGGLMGSSLALLRLAHTYRPVDVAG